MVRLDGAREKGLNSTHINAKWEKKKKKKNLEGLNWKYIKLKDVICSLEFI